VRNLIRCFPPHATEDGMGLVAELLARAVRVDPAERPTAAEAEEVLAEALAGWPAAGRA
jgi:hypothetical protein